MKRILFSVHEKSADIYASNLSKQLKHYSLIGFGGPELSRMHKGIKDITHKTADMGIPLKKIPFYIRIYNTLKQLSKTADITILVDFGGLHIPFLKYLHKTGKRVIYFIPPKFWAWGYNRIKYLKLATAVFPLFKFEHNMLIKNGVSSYYFGHPLYENLKQIKIKSIISDRIGLFPGSREVEIKKTLPIMLDALNNYKGEVMIFISQDNYQIINTINNIAINKGIPFKLILPDIRYEVMSTLSKAIACSGTVNLELSYFGIPTIVVYKLNNLVYKVFKPLIKTRFISLPNILLKKMIYPELVQDNFNTKTLKYYLENNIPRRDEIIEKCDIIWEDLKGYNIYEKIASIIRGLM